MVKSLEFLGPQRMPERRHRRFGLLSTDPGLQSSRQCQPLRSTVLQVLPAWRDDPLRRERHKQVFYRPRDDAVEAGRSDANDGDWLGVNEERLVDHRGIGSEVRLPIVEAEYRHEIRIQRLVGWHEQTAERGTDPQRFEVIAGDEFAAGHIWFVVPANCDILLVVRDYSLHDLIGVAQVAVHRIRKIIGVITPIRVEVAGWVTSQWQRYELFGM